MDTSDLGKILARLEQRLSDIEARLPPVDLQTVPDTSVQPVVAAPVNEKADQPSVPHVTVHANPWNAYGHTQSPAEQIVQSAVPTPKKPKTSDQDETSAGNWLGIVAVLCFVLAAGFIIKLSIDTGWFTPVRQIGLASLLGVGLIGGGLYLRRADQEYAGLLPGAGIIILYLSTLGAHKFYHLISFEAGITLTFLVSGTCIWLYTLLRHDLYALTSAVGAYLCGVAIGYDAGAVFTLYYFAVCSLTFAGISIWLQSRLLTLVSAYLSIILTGLIGLLPGVHDGMAATLLGVHFVIFTVSTYLYSKQNGPMTRGEANSFLPVLLAFYAFEYFFIDALYPGFAPWVCLGFAFSLIGIYLFARRYFSEGLESQSLIMAFATLAFFHSVYLELLPQDCRPWLFVAFFAFAALIPKPSNINTGSWGIPVCAVLIILAVEYFRMAFNLYQPGRDYSYDLVVGLAALGALWAFLASPRQNFLETRPEYGTGILVAAHLLAMLALYRLTEDVGSLAVSASWLFYAVAVMLFAFSRQDKIMAKSALLVLAFAAGKALLYDTASAQTIVRILCLLLTGAVLYGCGFMMRRISAWATERQTA